MNVLVTGATGWLGSRFVENIIGTGESKWARDDWHVSCLVLPGEDSPILQKYKKLNKVDIIYADLTKRETLKGVIKNIDIVFHTAGLIHPDKIKELYNVNTIGTMNLINECYDSGVKKFVYISSNSVSGVNPNKHQPLTETSEPNPYLNYGLSKYYAECIVKSFNEDKKMGTVILRPCWFYGPNQPKRQTTFFNMIMKGNPIIFGDGRNFRSMSYIDNTCQAMILAAESNRSKGQIYWVSDSRPYTTLEIYQTVADILGVKIFRPKHLPNLVSGVFLLIDKIIQSLGLYIKEVHVAGEMNKDIFCSNEKAIKELGYAPEIGLKEGMERSISWCRERKLIK